LPIPTDKLLHFLVGYSLTFTSLLIFSKNVTILIVIVVAAIKEFYDYFHKDHNCEFNDFIATIYGLIIALLVIYLIFTIIY